MKKHVFYFGMLMCLLAALTGCKKKEEVQEISTETQTEIVMEEPETETQIEKHEGEMRSFYTGEWIDEKLGYHRPVAVMTENTHVTLPQYGLSHADVIYECPVEGGITRLMTIYQDFADLEKVGNVRSCRLYYVYFAKEFGAVYFHAGESKYALDVLNSSFIDNVDGITGKGGAFYYRDNSRKAPHNLYTTGANLVSAIEKYGYENTLSQDYEPHYQFTTEDAPNLLENGVDAAAVKMYYVDAKPWFLYNEEDGLYYRYEFGEKQVDGETGNQLAVKNIIIQNCYSSLKNANNGTLDIDYLSGGTGKYITNGKAIDITWSRASSTDKTRYYDMEGKEIVLNPGKTWVEISENSRSGNNIIYSTKEEFQK